KYVVGEGVAELPDSFRHSIHDLKAEFKDLKRWDASVFFGTGVLFPFGLYLDASMSVPLAIFKDKVKVDNLEDHTLNQDYIHHVRGHYSDNVLAINIGFDFFMMVTSQRKSDKKQDL